MGTTRWLAARMDYMDSEESTRLIPEWVQYVNYSTTSPLSDYDVPDPSCKTPTCGFTSFNSWFSRNLKNNNMGPNPPWPISNKDDDSILVAPADSEINFILSSITMETLLPVKTRSIDVKSLLGNSQFAEKFNRGTAISCVLMPNNYHRFHSPVTGSLVESRLVQGFYFGISDGATWFNRATRAPATWSSLLSRTFSAPTTCTTPVMASSLKCQWVLQRSALRIRSSVLQTIVRRGSASKGLLSTRGLCQ